MIDKHCSLSNTDWFTFEVLFHPENKQSLPDLRDMNLSDFLDYKEALLALTMIKEAQQKDAEMLSARP